jgi:hypothetical protein
MDSRLLLSQVKPNYRPPDSLFRLFSFALWVVEKMMPSRAHRRSHFKQLLMPTVDQRYQTLMMTKS